MRLHFIGIGERTMADLAIALHNIGHFVTGSDVILDTPLTVQGNHPSCLIPKRLGWFPQKIVSHLDHVIVGERIDANNVELQAAQSLGIPVYTYSGYICEYARDKQRIVVTGDKERKLVCTLTLHVLDYLKKVVDYVVEVPLPAVSVKLNDAPIIILEGDSSPSFSSDSRPKSLQYQHNMVLMATDQQASRTYPTPHAYLQYVTNLMASSPKGGTVVYCEEDTLIKAVVDKSVADVKKVPYKEHTSRQEKGNGYLVTPQGDIPFPLNSPYTERAVAGSQYLLRNLAVNDAQFYEALATFRIGSIAS